MTQTFNIRLYKAPDDLETNQKFVEGHTEVLRHFGITQITSANTVWFEDPDTFVLVAEHPETKEVLAGIRVQIASDNNKIPIVSAVYDDDPYVLELVQNYRHVGTGELCGLWNSRKIKGIGVSDVLIRAGVSILDHLNVKTLFGLCDIKRYDVMRDKGGYDIEKSLGHEGTFYYPKQNLIAVAIILRDSKKMQLADDFTKKSIQATRKDPVALRIEQGNNGDLQLNYNLFVETDWVYNFYAENKEA